MSRKTSSVAAIACLGPLLVPLACSGDIDFESSLLEDHALEIEQEIRNGSTVVPPFVETLTVRISNSVVPGNCTGTLLRRNVVLTARHCTTGDRSITGAPVPADSMLVCTNAGSCSQLTEDPVHYFPNVDVALLFLQFSLGTPHDTFTTMDAIDPQEYALGTTFLMSGFGLDGVADSGILRVGTTQLLDAAVLYGSSVPADQGAQFRGMHLGPTQAIGLGGQVARPGDSGGPLWSTMTRPPSVVGVHSTAVDTQNEARAQEFRGWANNQIRQRMTHTASVNLTFSAPSEILNLITTQLGGSSATWTISGGKLTQPNNVPASAMLFNEFYTNASAVVTMEGWDNDPAGLILRYVDPNTFYRVEVDEQHRRFRVVRRLDGVERILAQERWTGTLDNPKRLAVSISNDFIAAALTDLGGNDAQITLSAIDPFIVAGRIGPYQNYNNDIEFDDLVIQAHPDFNTNAGLQIASGWTTWLSHDTPAGTGDYERVSDFPSVCTNPSAIQARVKSTKQDVIDAAERVVMTRTHGFQCVNSWQPDSACQDYEVRFHCP